jgi:hypothetical protein
MPAGAKVLEWHGFLGFPTRVRYQLSNTEEVEWISRQQRKHGRLPFTGRTREWWESERISQWMCVLFMIGSFAFTLGALLCFDLSIPLIVPGAIFFVGSLFFTSAAYLQFLEALKPAWLCRVRNFSHHILYSSCGGRNNQCECHQCNYSDRRCVFLCWRFATTFRNQQRKC